MMKLIQLTMMVLIAPVIYGQSIYVQSFGNENAPPLIFLHGGPGYNSVVFERTIAEDLAKEGFFVITYDRRGEGRSIDDNAKFTFQETVDDLDAILKRFKLEKAALIGHSFGGMVATLFAEQNSSKVSAVVLVGAPISLQETFKTIIAASKEIYQENKDAVNLNYISMLENMDTTTLQYSSYCFVHAMQNGFYSTQDLTDKAKQIYSTFKTDTLLARYGSQMTYEAPEGFWENERYTTLDLKKNLETLVSGSIPVYGLYGKDDGLYSEEQVREIQQAIGDENLLYLDDCSHNVFIDKSEDFIMALKEWIN